MLIVDVNTLPSLTALLEVLIKYEGSIGKYGKVEVSLIYILYVCAIFIYLAASEYKLIQKTSSPSVIKSFLIFREKEYSPFTSILPEPFTTPESKSDAVIPTPCNSQ